MTSRIEDWLMRAGVWLVCMAARRTFGRDDITDAPTDVATRKKAEGLLRDEIMAAPRNVVEALTWLDAEAALLSARLTRRYDPSMALNEAMARSVEAKKAAEREGMGLTSKQLAAMEWRKQKMRGRLGAS